MPITDAEYEALNKWERDPARPTRPTRTISFFAGFRASRQATAKEIAQKYRDEHHCDCGGSSLKYNTESGHTKNCSLSWIIKIEREYGVPHE